MDNRAEALNVVMEKGPLQPSQIATTVNTNILFASAILSELVDNKKVKITHVKRGGSPFYYVQGQEEKLMDLAKYLSENETKILAELNTTQGHHVDIGGYYHPDIEKMAKAMRPSETLNKAIDSF